ncbi:MAG: 5'-methylthioadenosine/S-adenosylhomocysteine nucleosidase [Pseudomonadota bacterium]
MTSQKDNAKIGIIAAMPSEITGIIAEIVSPKQTVISSVTFIEGYIHEKNVVVAYSGIGKVNAAIVTTLMCTHFEPRLLMMTGIAGSLHDQLAIGDVVIATTLFNTEKLSYPSDSDNLKNPINHQKTPLTFSPQIVNNALHTITKDFKIKYGSIATSDDFPTRKTILEFAIAHKADIIDMEAAAFAQVCWAFNRDYLVIKSVSNSALDEVFLYKKDATQNLVIQEKSLIDDTAMAKAIYHAEYVALETIKTY